MHLSSGWQAACQEKPQSATKRESGGLEAGEARSLLEIAAVCGCRHRRTCSMRGNRIPPRVRTWPTYPRIRMRTRTQSADHGQTKPKLSQAKPKSVPTALESLLGLGLGLILDSGFWVVMVLAKIGCAETEGADDGDGDADADADADARPTFD